MVKVSLLSRGRHSKLKSEVNLVRYILVHEIQKCENVTIIPSAYPFPSAIWCFIIIYLYITLIMFSELETQLQVH